MKEALVVLGGEEIGVCDVQRDHYYLDFGVKDHCSGLREMVSERQERKASRKTHLGIADAFGWKKIRMVSSNIPAKAIKKPITC